MNTLIDFITFKDPNVLYVVLGMLFINSSSALIGTFAFLRKRALIGDAVAHALLPGLCLGFMFAGEKNITYLMIGAFASGWLATYAIDLIVNRSKVKQDAAIGIVLSSFFGLGIVLLTYIQKNSGGQHSGLDHFLFGQAAAINKSEIIAFGIILLMIVVALVLFYKAFVVVAFNKDFAHSIGLPVRFIEFLITSLTVLAIAAGIQALGVILMSALIVTPGAAARLWTHKLRFMLVLAVCFSVFSGIGGAYVSYANSGMPTGPWVVVILSVFMFGSILIAPQKGMISRYRRSRRNKDKILLENILKSIYHWHERQKLHEKLDLKLQTADFISMRKYDTDDLLSGLKKLMRKDFVLKDGETYFLTQSGKEESRRIVRLHRLWEQYLLKRTTIDTDHVHSGAEAIEHIISPELEKELEKELGITGIPEEDY
ncbi:MAG: manganese/zinc/iron transport system permease protein [Arenicella sp.]|jgi:manganese/zinc/iron transport system permease protein